MSPPDLARVAAIIDPYQVAINRGAANGLKVGQRFLVYTLGDEIIDPENGLSLGKLEIVRGSGKVVHLQEKIATLKSDQVKQRRLKTRNPALGYLFGDTDEVILDDLPFDEPSVGDLAKPI